MSWKFHVLSQNNGINREKVTSPFTRSYQVRVPTLVLYIAQSMQQHPHILPPPLPETSRSPEKQSNLIRFQAELEVHLRDSSSKSRVELKGTVCPVSSKPAVSEGTVGPGVSGQRRVQELSRISPILASGGICQVYRVSSGALSS